MHQSEYAIATLVDSTGRLAVCSELMGSCMTKSKYSISVESYVALGEDPKQLLLDKFNSQLGIPIEDLKKVKKLDSNRIEYVLPSVGIRLIHTYIFRFKHPITMEISNPKINPMDFVTLDDVVEVFDGALIELSFCAKKMLEYIRSKRRYALHSVFNPY